MALSVSEIAAHLAAEFHGDGARLIDCVAPIHAAAPNTITFVSNPRFRGRGPGDG
jgi:UDP-3-O-[3-hydroxymyristoyl] glucosamine N-acyltransferase